MSKHTRKPFLVTIEPESLRQDVLQALTSVAERARELEATGRSVFSGTADASFDDPDDELREHASRVRCGARHAAGLALELEAMAGRLDGIALARHLIEANTSIRRSVVPGRRRAR